MGNTNGTIDFEYKISVNDYKPVQKIKDLRLGELIQMKHQTTDKVVMMREKIIKHSETYRKTVEDHINHMALKHKNLTRVYGFAGSDSQEKNKARIYVYFEYLTDTLQGEINAKKLSVGQKTTGSTKSNSKFFAEKNLFKITADIVDVLEYFQQNSMSHGDIKPDSCFIGKSGVIKLMDRSLICDMTSAFELVRDGNRSYFLTPRAFECIKKKQNEPMEDKYRADVFSLGMTLLECAALKPSSQIYDWNNYTINLTMLSNRLMEVKERYSPNFYNLVRSMLRLDEEQRPDFITLKAQLAEEGWINPYLTSSPNYTDEDVPELAAQLETKTTPSTQTKTFKDSQLAALVSPNNNSSIAFKGNKNIFSKNALPKTSMASKTQNRFINMRNPSPDDSMEDVPPSDRLYTVNKVPEATINRSTQNLKSPKSFMSQTGTTTSLHDMVLSRNQTINRPRDTATSTRTIDGGPVTDKIKNKFSKLQGHFSKNSKPVQQQAPQDFQMPQHLQSAAKPNRTKGIFSDKKESSRNGTLSDYRTESEFDASMMKYQYNYEPENTPAKKEFSVENLLQETVQISSKHNYFIPDSFIQPIQQHHSKSDKPNMSGNSGVSNARSQFLNSGISPFSKSKLVLMNFSHSIEQAPRENRTPNEEDCNSEVTYFAPDAANGFSSPCGNSFIEFDSVRSSHRPVVVDVFDNPHGFDKSLIDSIVRPLAENSRPFENAENYPVSRHRSIFQGQKTPVNSEEPIREKKQEGITHTIPHQVKSHIKPLAKNELRDDKIIMDTSLEEDLEQPQVEPFALSNNMSTKEEFAPQEGSATIQTNEGKLIVEEDDLDDRIMKAIERSRQTYLMTLGGAVQENKDANVYSNASDNRFSDILASDNAINNDQIAMGYETGENKFAQLSGIQS